MDILVTSDLHYGATRSGDACVRALAERACAESADVLVLAGDLAEGEEALSACLALFASFPGAKLAVPGNHDVWLRAHRARDSWHLHEEVLPDLFARHGFHPLHLSPWRSGDVAFVGSMGWYDYSFRDDIGIDLDWYRRKTLPPMTRPIWNDARHARFHEDDETLTGTLAARLARQLDDVPLARDVVSIVHHVTTKALLVHPRELVPRVFRFANAFLGAERFSSVIERDPRVRLSISGHIHRDKRIERGGRTLATLGASHRGKVLLRATERALGTRTLVTAPA